MTAPLNIRLKDDFEKKRLESLAGDNTLTDFILGLAFAKEGMPNTSEYPGWTVVERGRRDKGIKISHPKHGTVVLYPEDDAYGQFED